MCIVIKKASFEIVEKTYRGCRLALAFWAEFFMFRLTCIQFFDAAELIGKHGQLQSANVGGDR